MTIYDHICSDLERRQKYKKTKKEDFKRWWNRPKNNGTFFFMYSYFIVGVVWLFPYGICAHVYPEIDEYIEFLYPGPSPGQIQPIYYFWKFLHATWIRFDKAWIYYNGNIIRKCFGDLTNAEVVYRKSAVHRVDTADRSVHNLQAELDRLIKEKETSKP